jgi:large subunit ribosomal protein L35
MPKLKTKSSVKKRFATTASGKVKAAACNKNHFKSKKSSRALADICHGKTLNSTNAKKMKKLAPYGL